MLPLDWAKTATGVSAGVVFKKKRESSVLGWIGQSWLHTWASESGKGSDQVREWTSVTSLGMWKFPNKRNLKEREVRGGGTTFAILGPVRTLQTLIKSLIKHLGVSSVLSIWRKTDLFRDICCHWHSESDDEVYLESEGRAAIGWPELAMEVLEDAGCT